MKISVGAIVFGIMGVALALTGANFLYDGFQWAEGFSCMLVAAISGFFAHVFQLMQGGIINHKRRSESDGNHR